MINTKFLPQPLLSQIPQQSGTWLVGGSVRDQLLCRPFADWDLAVEHDPAGLARAIAEAEGSRVVVLGKKKQIIHRVVSAGRIFDIAAIQGQTISEDLLRRDFTVNAMALSLPAGRLIDPAGGRNDLERQVIRMTGKKVLDDDPLRLLRAFRMAAILGFSIDPETLAAVSEKAGQIRQVAGERIRDEWQKILRTPDSAQWISLMDQAGLLGSLFPEIEALKNCGQNRHHEFDVFDHTMAVYKGLEQMLHQNRPALTPNQTNKQLLSMPAATELLKHAALLHDIGKPQTRTADNQGRIHFYHHPGAGAQMAGQICRRLKFSCADAGYVTFLIHHHLRPLFLYRAQQREALTTRAVTRFFIKTRPRTPDLLLLAAADMTGKKEHADTQFMDFAAGLLQRYFTRHLPARQRPRLLKGHDLIHELGLCPSPLFATILDRVEEGRLAGDITSRDQALELARKIVETQKDA
ncbi:MAG: HD domain-containing protein [Desulfobacterales bacterium]|nr:HD domain-containing protein [Desulfobacterales bacterium]